MSNQRLLRVMFFSHFSKIEFIRYKNKILPTKPRPKLGEDSAILRGLLNYVLKFRVNKFRLTVNECCFHVTDRK